MIIPKTNTHRKKGPTIEGHFKGVRWQTKKGVIKCQWRGDYKALEESIETIIRDRGKGIIR